MYKIKGSSNIQEKEYTKNKNKKNKESNSQDVTHPSPKSFRSFFFFLSQRMRYLKVMPKHVLSTQTVVLGNDIIRMQE